MPARITRPPARLSCLPDRHRRRGRRHPLPYVLAVAACAVLAGAKSLTAIAEWAACAAFRPAVVHGTPGRTQPAGRSQRYRWPAPEGGAGTTVVVDVEETGQGRAAFGVAGAGP
ncbi:transposase family protein [Streptomyces sp. NPDC007251]|uniref:transposase family protein n=1 Tax=unclassified Streptomyces TaxID=2593676 RepID=UPI0033CB1280